MSRPVESLRPEEVLALAVAVERANTRRFRTFASLFRGYDEGVADRFEEMAQEEETHERMLLERFRVRFGGEMPVMEESDVRGVVESIDMDDAEHLIFDTMDPEHVYALALKAEQEAQRFYRRAAEGTEDTDLATLFEELAEMENSHCSWVASRLAMAKRGGTEE